MVTTNTTPLLEMRGIGKAFPGVQALSGVDLTLHRGEVLALLGENGAGKSTLIKVLSGAHQPDEGSIHVEGEPVVIRQPVDAERHGIAVIYQEFNLIPALSVVDNICLGNEQRARGLFIDRAGQVAMVRRLFDQIGVSLDPHALVRNLTVAQQQVVEIVKALSREASILVMDEPSAALSHNEVDRMFAVVDELKAQGMGVIYISHRLDEIDRLADRVSVLRDGEHVATQSAKGLERDRLIELMVGRKLENEFPVRSSKIGDVRLAVRGVNRMATAAPVSFEIRRGEVLGLTGLVGAGRTELARMLFGADSMAGGEILLDGKPLVLRSPREAIEAGICLLTEDRKAQGLVLGLSVRENFGLPNLDQFTSRGLIRRKQETSSFEKYVDRFAIKIPHVEQRAGHLSGGNQQKVVLAKWLFRDTDVLLFDEPTRGIDVGAKYEIYQLINQLAEEGKAILMISSELPEVIGMSDRILVMREGAIQGELNDIGQVTQEDILRMAMGES
ncbi:MAG: ribose transport system ATP-binding protein [Verrucomicrobiales bacterium]|jgi:ribose transport system ATP-binding protein